MTSCRNCSKNLTTEEITYSDSVIIEHRLCFECHSNVAIELLATQLREARITFEEAMRKLMGEMNK